RFVHFPMHQRESSSSGPDEACDVLLAVIERTHDVPVLPIRALPFGVLDRLQDERGGRHMVGAKQAPRLTNLRSAWLLKIEERWEPVDLLLNHELSRNLT